MSSTAFPPLSPSEPPRVFGAPTLHTENDLLAVGIAADGVLWSVEEPGLLREWSLATRRQLGERTLDELATVWTFNWAARLLASASDEVAVWEVSSGEQLAGWSAFSWVTALAFQPGAPILASGHDDGLVCVWNWIDRTQLFDLRGAGAAISALAFSPDGRRLAGASENRVILVWDLRTGEVIGALEGHTDRIPALAWHPDSRRLFSAGWDTTVRVWDTHTFEPIILLNSHATQVHALALSGDGKLLASADSDNAVHVWDVEANRTLTVLREQTGEVRCLAFTPDDGKGNLSAPMLAWGTADRVIHLWDSARGAGGAEGLDPLLSRTVAAVSPDGKWLYSLGAGTDLRCWAIETAGAQPRNGKPREGRPSLEGGPVLRTFASSPDGKWLAGARAEAPEAPDDRKTLALYEAATGRRRAVCEGQRNPVTALAFSPDGRLLASGGVQSSDVWLWRVPEGEPELLIPDAVDDCSVEALAFQPTGELLAVAGIDWLATSGNDGEVLLWHLGERQVRRSLAGGATAVAFHPSGGLLARSGLDRTIRIHDVVENREAAELKGHRETVTCLAWSPDGSLLASGGEDRTVRLWDAGQGEQVGAWELDNSIRSLCFTPDGKHLFTGNGNTSCYQIEVEQLLASGM
jgi:WD40 repeat protein